MNAIIYAGLNVDLQKQFLNTDVASVSFNNILKNVSSYFSIKEKDILGKSRFQKISIARSIVAYYLRRKVKLKVLHIASLLNRDHSTILSAVKTGEYYCESDITYKFHYESILSNIYSSSNNVFIENEVIDDKTIKENEYKLKIEKAKEVANYFCSLINMSLEQLNVSKISKDNQAVRGLCALYLRRELKLKYIDIGNMLNRGTSASMKLCNSGEKLYNTQKKANNIYNQVVEKFK